MLTQDQLTLSNIRHELDRISNEMIDLIQKYSLDASSSLEIIVVARSKISDQRDYIRFLELSLEGRIYGEAAEMLEKSIVTEADEDIEH
ncbi:hypothetical protein [Emcibacter sp.]|uniref:hypothetical protein n=1 Tax=Emcibacter sp. TaxID=1979954 RepID=UPI002AA66D1E|nr:hypothetical protein [Emcibacter sp.]